MKGIILSNGNKVFFGKGRFDDWCVYYENKMGKFALRDTEYFNFFKCMSRVYGIRKIYDDFVSIYNDTTNEISIDTVHKIKNISLQYNESNEMEKYLSVIYLAMIAEENKENCVLGKRIKMLGIHNLLIDDMSPQLAANISKWKSWKVLNKYCLDRGF